jgi:hypothetical protein
LSFIFYGARGTEKYHWAINNPEAVARLARNGEQHVLDSFTFLHIANAMREEIAVFL